MLEDQYIKTYNIHLLPFQVFVHIGVIFAKNLLHKGALWNLTASKFMAWLINMITNSVDPR